MSGITRRFRRMINRVGRIFRRKKKSDKKNQDSESDDLSKTNYDRHLIYEEVEHPTGKITGSEVAPKDVFEHGGTGEKSELSPEDTDNYDGESDNDIKDSTKNYPLVRKISDSIPYEEFQYACISSDNNSSETGENGMEDSKIRSKETSPDYQADETLVCEEFGHGDSRTVASSTIEGTGQEESQTGIRKSGDKTSWELEVPESTCVNRISNTNLVETPKTDASNLTSSEIFPEDHVYSQADVFEVSVPEMITVGKPICVQNTTCASEQNLPKKNFPRAQCQNPFIDMDILTTMDILVAKVDHLVRNDPKVSVKRNEVNGKFEIQKPDAMVVINGQEFAVHRNLLSKESTYFKETFAGQENKQVVLHINSKYTNCSVFQSITTFIYTGIVVIHSKEFLNLWYSSKNLGMPRLTQHCKQLLNGPTNNIKNLLNIYETAYQRKLERSQVLKMLAQSFENLILQNDFLDFTPEQIVEVLSEDRIGARSEVVVFLAAMKWINYDFLEREEYITKIFHCIRFTEMTLQEVVACFHPPILPGVVEVAEIKTMLLNATCYLSAKTVHQLTT